MFAVITLVSVFGLIFALSFHHFKRADTGAKRSTADSKTAAYFPWLLNQALRFFINSPLKRCWKLVQNLRIWHYQEKEKWTFLSLILSFIFLTGSGFIYALFSRQTIHGLLLLLHVGFGGIYAISLSMALVLRAGAYSFHTEKIGRDNSLQSPREPADFSTVMQKMSFWLFVFSGLLLILSALTLMLPVFSLKGQIEMVEVHRYAALAALLSAISFACLGRANNLKR